MKPDDFAGLDIARYLLRLRALEDASLPAFLGSTLRGAFGHALKQAVCVMPHRDCERCMVSERCIYPYLFETPSPEDIPQLRGQRQAPHPFILSPPPPGAAIVRSVAGSVIDHHLAASGGLSVSNRVNPNQRIPVLLIPAPPGSRSLKVFEDLSPSPAALVASGPETSMEMWKTQLHVFPHFHSARKTRRKLRSEFSTVPTASTTTYL